jgi:hypothetical protein
MDSPVRQYRLLPGALPLAERALRKTALIPQLTIIVLVLVISALLFARRTDDTRSAIIFAIFIACFITCIAFVSPRRMHHRLARLWDSYTLDIGPDYLLRRQADTPEIRLAFSEIQRIERRLGHGLRIIGSTKLRVIGIPEGTERFDEVLQTVSALAPVQPPSTDRALRANILTGFGFAAYMVMLLSTSPWIVLPLALGLSTLLLWFVIFVQRSPNTTRYAKRTGWLYLLGVATCGLKVLATIGYLRK